MLQAAGREVAAPHYIMHHLAADFFFVVASQRSFVA